jgi:type I restriction enzyme, S subunit
MLWDGDRSGLVGRGLDGAVGSTVARLSCTADAHPGYLFHSLRRLFGWIQAHRTGTGVPHVPADIGRRLRIGVPPLSEQRQIAAILDTVDDAIRQTALIIAKLEQVKQGLLHDLLTRGIDDNGELRDPERHPERFKDSPLGRIPSHWIPKLLGDLSPRLAGRLIVQPHQYFAEHGVPIVFGTNIRPGSILIDGIKRISFQADARFAHCRARAGDLLTVRVGVPGMTAVIPSELDGCHFASTMWIRSADAFVSEWLCYCMNSTLVRRQIDAANYGSVQTQFNIREAASFVLPLPPRSEQVAVVERLSAFDVRVRDEESTLRKLRVVRLGVMEDLLTGRVRVTKLLETAAE